MLYSFDNFTLNSEERTLSRQEKLVALTPKVFETLLFLLKNHDRIVSKDELLSSIWPERFVEESNLTQNISVLRKSLGETTTGKKYIATFSGRGYRFLEPVVVDELASSPHSSQNIHSAGAEDRALRVPVPGWNLKRHRRLVLTGACAALFLAATLIISTHLNRRGHAIAEAAVPSFEPLVPIRTAVRMDGAQYQPAWSNSGLQLAFVHSSGAGADSAIYIQTVGRMSPRRITVGPGEYSSPAFSPDGKSLAFLHMRPNLTEILIYNLATAQTRRLATLSRNHYGLSCRQLDWAPSGDFLVVDDKEGESDPLSLYLVFVSNGDRVRVTYPDMDILGDTAPRFSPDGKQIAFIRMKYQYEYDAFVVPVNGGTPRKVTSESGILGDVGWGSSEQVVYTGDQNGEFRLWQVDLLAANPRPMLASTIATDMPLQFSIGQKSRQIAFSGYRPDLNIWALDLSKSAPSEADWRPVIRTPGQDITPFYSPDGKSIAFRSDVSGRLQLWVSRADGSNAVTISTGSLRPGVVSWAPDSQSIVFCSASAPGIYRVSLSAGFPVRRISNAPVSHPFYSTDGNWIFATAGNLIFRIPAMGGPAEVVTDHGGSPVRESRDGRYLFFSHRRMDTTISRLDLLTHKQKTVVDSLIPGYHDAWTITADGILFLTQEMGKPTIAFHDFKSGEVRKVGTFPSPLPIIATSGFSASPDGRTLLVVRADPASADIQTAAFSPPEEYATALTP